MAQSAFEQLRETIETDKSDYRARMKAQEDHYFGLRDGQAEKLALDPAEYKKYLDVQAAFHRMGMGNALAVAAQDPAATVLKTKFEWQQEGRRVDERADPILIRQKDANSGFNNVRPYFDLQQTEGKPFYQRQTVLDEAGLVQANKALLKAGRAQVVPVDTLDLPARYDPESNVIHIRSDLTHTEIFKYLPVEMAYSQILKPGMERGDYRLEAEGAAYLIHTRYGAQGLFDEQAKKTKKPELAAPPDFSHVTATYKGFSKDEIMQSIAFVRDRAFEMGDAIDRSINPPAREAYARRPMRDRREREPARPSRK